MRAPPSYRRLGAALLLSILLHLAGVWIADQVSLPEDQRPRFAVRLMAPEQLYQQRFERREGLSVPRERTFRSRPRLEVGPTDLRLVAPSVDTLLAERSLAAAERLQPLPAERLDQGIRELSTDAGWEDNAWQTWRDSLLRESRAVEKYRIPFDIERERRRSVVALDPETGRLERAQCYIPVYEHCAGAPLDPRGYNQRLLTLGERLRVMQTVWQQLHDSDRPLRAGQAGLARPDSSSQLIAHLHSRFELRCRTSCDLGPCVEADAIHTFREAGCCSEAGGTTRGGTAGAIGAAGRRGPDSRPARPGIGLAPPTTGCGCNHTCRDVLSYQEMSIYPVLLLEFVDAESSGDLALYLLEDGFAVMSARQLELVQRELARQLALSVPRSEIRAHVRKLMADSGMGEDHPSFAERYSDLCAEVVEKAVERHLKTIEIWSDHPLMEAYYGIRDHQPAPGSRPDPPLLGLELNGRLLAVARGERRDSGAFLSAQRSPELFVNAVVYGLSQPRGPAALRARQ